MENKEVLNVEGMTCTNCALTVRKVLEKEGLKEVNVNFATGEVSFEKTGSENREQAVKDINKLGYRVVSQPAESAHQENHSGHDHAHHTTSAYSSIEKKFYWSLLFSVPLIL